MSRWVAWAVHLLTASGAGLALAAAAATAVQAWQTAFLCLGIALVIDGIDGPLARWAGVSKELPWFDGGALDFVVDYSNYVLIPAFIVVQSGLLSRTPAIICGVIIAVVGALYFADRRMKTAENGFRGFPAVWNGVVFLLMVYRPNEILTFAIVAGFAVLTFLPVEFVHPIRVVRWRTVTLTVTCLWAYFAALLLAENLEPQGYVGIAFLLSSIYLASVGMVLQLIRVKKLP